MVCWISKCDLLFDHLVIIVANKGYEFCFLFFIGGVLVSIMGLLKTNDCVFLVENTASNAIT